MTSTWSEAFKAYIARRWAAYAQKEAALALRVSPSTVHYWCRGARPRAVYVRAGIEHWSDGEVPAYLPAARRRRTPRRATRTKSRTKPRSA